MNEQRKREIEEAFAQENSKDVLQKLSRLVRQKCDEQKIQISSLSLVERIPNRLLMFNFEVRNGGFCQYFDNSSGDDWPELRDILESIGAVNTTNLLEQALSIFPNGTPATNNAAIREQLNEMDDSGFDILYALDKKYYSQEENIFTLAVNYLKMRKDDFS